MIIAVANTKGGTGKTTTAVQLALYRQSLGHEVWLVDGDEQQSALTAVSIRSENNVKPALACSAYSDARTLKSQIETQVNMEDIIRDARDIGADFDAYCFLSCADSQGADNQEAAEVMKQCEEMRFLDKAIGRRKAFATAGGAGLSVFELRPKDAKACFELKALADAIYNL